MNPPSPHTAITFLSGYTIRAAMAAGSPAPIAALSGTVETQEPAAGHSVAAGSRVTLRLHSEFAAVRRNAGLDAQCVEGMLADRGHTGVAQGAVQGTGIQM